MCERNKTRIKTNSAIANCRTAQAEPGNQMVAFSEECLSSPLFPVSSEGDNMWNRRHEGSRLDQGSGSNHRGRR